MSDTKKWEPRTILDEDYVLKPRTNEWWRNGEYYVIEEEEVINQYREGLKEPAGFSDNY